jgi:hypothetical protein
MDAESLNCWQAPASVDAVTVATGTEIKIGNIMPYSPRGIAFYFVPVLSSCFISASTIWSMLKLAGRWLGGYSLKV